MKANKPKAPKEKITFDNVNPDEFDKHFITIKRGTYVSKKKLKEWIDKYKASQKEYWQCVTDGAERNKLLRAENADIKSSLSQLAEENKVLKEKLKHTFTCYLKNKGWWFGKFSNKAKELREEIKIAKFNFRWAMIATAAFILSIIYILKH